MPTRWSKFRRLRSPRELENAPALIQISHRALEHVGNGNTTLGLRYMAAIGKIAAQSVGVPIGLHLDHAGEAEVLQAIALGFTSVMFDGGDLPLAQNIVITSRLRGHRAFRRRLSRSRDGRSAARRSARQSQWRSHPHASG